jgi:hypothetical protein
LWNLMVSKFKRVWRWFTLISFLRIPVKALNS